jgi:hypothetical protein
LQAIALASDDLFEDVPELVARLVAEPTLDLGRVGRAPLHALKTFFAGLLVCENT